jgi:murein DD-endopeptidase MepM/ murein hydrolase activator NlpD
MVNSEEKYYVSTYQECDDIINELKEKDSNNIDDIAYIVKYESDLKEFTTTDVVVASLYEEKPKTPVVSASTTMGSVVTGANMSYAKVDLGVSFINPISGSITSRFGVLSSIRSSAHTGLDIGASTGTPIAAAASGTVTFSGKKNSYGYLITIDHGNGVLTYYAHCSALYKSVGEVVEQGDIIAAVGNTGNSTGPHLHIEVRVNGVAYNPQDYFNY